MIFSVSDEKKEAISDEAYQDFDDQEPEGVREEGRLRRVPDFLPVCLQDFLHGGKPEL
jgi:hypothetical protein